MEVPFIQRFFKNEVLSPQNQKAAPGAEKTESGPQEKFEQGSSSAQPTTYRAPSFATDVTSGETHSGFSLGCSSGDGGHDFGVYHDKDEAGQSSITAAAPTQTKDDGTLGGWIVS